MSELDYIAENIKSIRQRVAAAALKNGRKPEDITIIAVTKTVEPDKILKAWDENLIDFGENRVQELKRKYDLIDRPCNWHLIGHLQKNKVKDVIGKAKLIHSVDNYELAQEIQKRAANACITMDVLIETNISGEESKFGIAPDQLKEFIREIAVLPNLKVKGLMTIAPNFEEKERTRPIFKELYKIFVDIRKENIDNIDMKCISAGMSNDFDVAIEEGSNIVRVGTSIFGKRTIK